MGFSRPHSIVVRERLANYFINKKKYDMSLEQLVDIATGLDTVYYENRVKNSNEVANLMNYLRNSVKEAKGKK